MADDGGEQVLFRGHPSWRSMIGLHLKGAAASAAAGALAGLASAAASGGVELGWVVAAVLAGFAVTLAGGLIRRRRTTYTITSRRLTIQLGLLAREVHETRLERVQNVSSRQSLLERALNVGTVDFDTAGESAVRFSFRGVARPAGIVRAFDRALQARAAATPGGGERPAAPWEGERTPPPGGGERPAAPRPEEIPPRPEEAPPRPADP